MPGQVVPIETETRSRHWLSRFVRSEEAKSHRGHQ